MTEVQTVTDPIWKWSLLININLFSSAKELIEPCHVEKEHVKISNTSSCRKVGQTHMEWQACEQLENKRQMYGSKAINRIILGYILFLS